MKYRRYTLVVLVLLVVLSISIPSLARYMNESKNKANIDIAKWNFKINDSTITSSTISLASTIDTNNKYSTKYVVPGTNGVIPIEIDADDSEVSLSYKISFNLSQLPDNLHIYTDSNKTLLFDSSNIVEDTILITDTNKKNNYNLYWEWEYKTDETSNKNDSLWQDKNIELIINIEAKQIVRDDIS